MNLVAIPILLSLFLLGALKLPDNRRYWYQNFCMEWYENWTSIEMLSLNFTM